MIKPATIKRAKAKVSELEQKLGKYSSPYLIEQLKKAKDKLKSLEQSITGTQQKLI